MKNMIEEYGMVLVVIIIGSLIVTSYHELEWLELFADPIRGLCDGVLS